jgi:hypothetical protein
MEDVLRGLKVKNNQNLDIFTSIEEVKLAKEKKEVDIFTFKRFLCPTLEFEANFWKIKLIVYFKSSSKRLYDSSKAQDIVDNK